MRRLSENLLAAYYYGHSVQARGVIVWAIRRGCRTAPASCPGAVTFSPPFRPWCSVFRAFPAAGWATFGSIPGAVVGGDFDLGVTNAWATALSGRQGME